MTEEWREIPGHVGSYEVSNLGRVRSLDRVTDRGRNWKGRILALSDKERGYKGVALWGDGMRHHYLVHRLVLLAFVGPPTDGVEGLHRNGDSSDNRLANLSWGTHSENQLDQVRHGTHPNASKNECPSGHPYDESNTYIRPRNLGRACRACRAVAASANYRAKRQLKLMEVSQ